MKGYSRNACTDFDAKYVKQRGSAKPKSKVSTPIFPKTAIFGTHFDGTLIFSPENGFSIGRLESKRPLIVVVAQ